jgi:hypothetical protein
MSECLPDLPSYVRQRGDEWQGADHPDGPWRPIPAPQSGLPWPVPPVTEESSAPQPTPADRLALAMCNYSTPCSRPCLPCRLASARHSRELAAILRERHGSSTTADWLDGVGAHK